MKNFHQSYQFDDLIEAIPTQHLTTPEYATTPPCRGSSRPVGLQSVLLASSRPVGLQSVLLASSRPVGLQSVLLANHVSHSAEMSPLHVRTMNQCQN
jgi:hypothetical protein